MINYNLQHCPRCGFMAFIEVHREASPQEYEVRCGNEECRFGTPSFILMEDALAEWNKLCNASAKEKEDYEGLVKALEDYINYVLNRFVQQRVAVRDDEVAYMRLTHKIAGVVRIARKLKNLKREFNISDEEES